MKKQTGVTLKQLRQLIREELGAQPAASGGDSGLGKVVGDMVSIFTNRMKAQFPDQTADAVIKREADQLRTQILAQIKASATQVKTAVKQPF